MKLNKLLQQWDGKHVAYLKGIYERNRADSSFMNAVIKLYQSNSGLERSTSWLIKHHYDNHEELSEHQERKILIAAKNLHHWESQLHILQLIPRFSLSRKTAESVEPFVSEKLNSNKKFVKAAAYDAYYEITQRIPELRNEFRLICEDAMIKESASVKAKVRKILTKL